MKGIVIHLLLLLLLLAPCGFVRSADGEHSEGGDNVTVVHCAGDKGFTHPFRVSLPNDWMYSANSLDAFEQQQSDRTTRATMQIAYLSSQPPEELETYNKLVKYVRDHPWAGMVLNRGKQKIVIRQTYLYDNSAGGAYRHTLILADIITEDGVVVVNCLFKRRIADLREVYEVDKMILSIARDQ